MYGKRSVLLGFLIMTVFGLISPSSMFAEQVAIPATVKETGVGAVPPSGETSGPASDQGPGFKRPAVPATISDPENKLPSASSADPENELTPASEPGVGSDHASTPDSLTGARPTTGVLHRFDRERASPLAKVILQPLLDDLTRLDIARKELARQAEVRKQQLRQNVAFLENQRGLLLKFANQLLAERKAALEEIEEGLGTLEKMATVAGEKVYLPTRGWEKKSTPEKE